MNSTYGVAEDWPLSYDDLEPYYEQVETLMQINGGGSDHILPRRMPFPFPAHRPSRSDRLMRSHSPNWFAQPTARSSGGDRANCCANGICDRCPLDAKYSILNSLEQFLRPGVSVMLDSEVRAVIIEAGRATGVALRSAGQDHVLATTGGVALATNAMFNAAILLRSGVTHPALGRGINEQTSRFVKLDGDGLGYYGGTSITGHGYDLYDGPHRATLSGAIVELHNAPAHLRDEPGKWTQRVQMRVIVEDLRQSQNRVILEDDEMVIEWHGHSEYALQGLDRAIKKLPDIIPSNLDLAEVGDLEPTEAHIMGTHVFGHDPARHVTDADMNLHGYDGLWALGAGAFPTTSPANPSLTLSALSLRAGGMVS